MPLISNLLRKPDIWYGSPSTAIYEKGNSSRIIILGGGEGGKALMARPLREELLFAASLQYMLKGQTPYSAGVPELKQSPQKETL